MHLVDRCGMTTSGNGLVVGSEAEKEGTSAIITLELYHCDWPVIFSIHVMYYVTERTKFKRRSDEGHDMFLSSKVNEHN